MTALLKAGAAVRALAAVAPPERPSPEALALARAEAEVARLTRLLAETERRARDLEREAFAAGRTEGTRDAADAADARLDLMREATRAALAAWRERLRDLDSLAAELVRAALAKLFAPSEDLAELTVRAVRRRIAELEAGSVVTLAVSAADFPTDAAAAALAPLAETVDAPLTRSAALAPGTCRVELRVGEHAIGPRDQWPALAALLAEFAEEHAA